MPDLTPQEAAAVAVVLRAQMEGRAMHVRDLSPLLGDALVKLTRMAGGARAVIEAGGEDYAAEVAADSRPHGRRCEAVTSRLDEPGGGEVTRPDGSEARQ